MGARKHYPVPACAKCKKQKSKVCNTYYLDDGQILRHRECLMCGWRQWSKQPAEQAINPATHQVVIPRFGKKARNGGEIRPSTQNFKAYKIVQIKPSDNS